MALWYAYGPYEVAEAEAGSAFSTGDILTYDGNSRVSRAGAYPLGPDIAGIALTPSDRSVNNKVTYLKANPDTVLWSDVTGGSTMTRGLSISFSYDTIRGYPSFYAVASAGTFTGVVERGVGEVNGQSVQSRILCRIVGEDSIIHN